MQSRPTKVTFRMKKDENGSSSVKTEENGINESTFPGQLDSTLQQPSASSSLEEEDDRSSDDEDNRSSENAQNQLVVYDPTTNGDGDIEAVQPLRSSLPNQSSRALPSVGAFTIQCANCFKWRLIPTKEKYEEIREHILEQPFLCETAREWRPDISCDDPEDISQDGSRLWAIDKPNIALPPPGWQRLLRIRGEGSTKFADVYYVAPSGKRLRSMVEIQKYLQEHPEYMTEGVTMSQFSFQTPRPLQENYVRKRPARLTGALDPSEAVHPLAWVGPDEITDLQLGGPGVSTSDSAGPAHEPVNRPMKKKARTQSNQNLSAKNLDNQHKVKVEEPHQARNGTYNL